MLQQNVAIIGLGRIGAVFFAAMRKRPGINILCVAERGNTPARQEAAAAGIMVATLDEIVGMSEILDIVFDLTGIPEVRRELRNKLRASNNQHTVIATETIARLVWSLIGEKDLPVIENRRTGY